MENIHINKKETIIAFIITIILAGLDLLGYPAAWFVNVHVLDVNPIYFTLIVNQWTLIIIGVVAIHYLCPNLKIGLGVSNLKEGIKKNWKLGLIVILWTFLSIAIGIVGKLDNRPTFLKVFIEAFFYYISVAIIEELYIRGLLLNIIERLCIKNKNPKVIAIMVSSVIFGLGHLFGMIGSVDAYTLTARVIWTIGLGVYLGVAYKMSNNLWVPIIIHFFINAPVGILISFKKSYSFPFITTTMMMCGFIVFAVISILLFQKSERKIEENETGFIVKS